MSKKIPKLIAVIDAETDPFKHNRIPKPFAWQFRSKDIRETFYGESPVVTQQFINFLRSLPEPYLIYAHNGGKFDFHLIADEIENPLMIINSRIVECKLGIHTLRDSYAILPVPLMLMGKKGTGKKEIDYSIMEKELRHIPANKAVILDYLDADCDTLLRFVTLFIKRFGARLTIGQTSMREIQKRHDFRTMKESDDGFFRQFYYGGRVQCFEQGALPGPWKIYDINSSYPKSMRDFKHPVNGRFILSNRMPDNFDKPFFLIFEGTNRNAIPVKTENGLAFNRSRGDAQGIFAATSHELQAALEFGMIDIKRVVECAVAAECISFQTFVDEFYAEKARCKLEGDDANEMFAKFLLNSGYGKFGTNPRDFYDWYINHDIGDDARLIKEGYALEAEFETFELWARPTAQSGRGYYDVSIAASITSASRSLLLRGIKDAIRPVYCDTDSIICRDFRGTVNSQILGAWKLEKEGPAVVIAGKKLYALYDPLDDDMVRGTRDGNGRLKKPPLKMASKGGNLTLPNLLEMSRGGFVDFENEAPTFSLHGQPRFISRKFGMTVDDNAISD